MHVTVKCKRLNCLVDLVRCPQPLPRVDGNLDSCTKERYILSPAFTQHSRGPRYGATDCFLLAQTQLFGLLPAHATDRQFLALLVDEGYQQGRAWVRTYLEDVIFFDAKTTSHVANIVDHRGEAASR